MKAFVLLLALLLGCAAGPALAQTTNGVTTSAEREALNAAATHNAQRQANAPGTSSSTGGSGIGVPTGRAVSQAENEARIRAQFGFKSAEEKTAAREAEAQRQLNFLRERNRAAAEARAQEVRNRLQDKEFERAASEAAWPWKQIGFTPGDALIMGLKTQLDQAGQPRGTATELALLDQARAARLAFQALYDQPTASYEQLRPLAQQLPLTYSAGSSSEQFGVGTALMQCQQLLRRFPAHRAAAAADVLRAGEVYLAWNRAFESDTRQFHQELGALLLEAAAANPTQGQLTAARLGKAAARMYELYYRNAGPDTLVYTRLLRFSYHGIQQCLRTGQVAATGLTEAELRADAAGIAAKWANTRQLTAEGANTAWLNQTRLALFDALSQPSQRAGAEALATPALLAPAEWARIGAAANLPGPVQGEAIAAWFADTIRYPDHPRWQTLTAPQTEALRQARVLAAWLLTNRPDLGYPPFERANRAYEKLAVWGYALAKGPADVMEVRNTWRTGAKQGSALSARNVYRLYRLGDKALGVKENKTWEDLYEPIQGLCDSQPYSVHHLYLAALIYLDEFPGLPPIGRKNKDSGVSLLQQAAAKGSTEAAARLQRGKF